jgi:hypothetical protein
MPGVTITPEQFGREMADNTFLGHAGATQFVQVGREELARLLAAAYRSGAGTLPTFVFHPDDPLLQVLPDGTHIIVQRA